MIKTAMTIEENGAGFCSVRQSGKEEEEGERSTLIRRWPNRERENKMAWIDGQAKGAHF